MINSWKTKNGDKILIKDMTTEHIKNCIKALEEERITVGESVDIGYTCDSDGDGIMYEFIDHSEDYIKAFKDELARRNNYGRI